MKRYLGFATVVLSLFVFAKTTSAQSYEAYLTSAQEVPTNASTGTGKARIVINAAGTSITYNITFTGLTSAQILGHIHSPAAIGANTGIQITFPVVGGTSGTISGTASVTATQVAHIRSGQAYVNIHTTNNSGGEIRGQLHLNRPVDFDGDGRTDFSVLRFPAGPPSPITYYNLRSTDGGIADGPWGDATTDFPVPGDYDGDGKDDLALYRNGATAGADSLYLIVYSATNTFQFVRWGVMGDQACARDFDGDGITDMAVFRRGTLATDPTFWYIRQSASGFVQRSVQWGITGDAVGFTNGDTPVPGDYDGDGKVDIAVYRFGAVAAPDNSFIVLRSSDGAAQFQQWGNFNSDYIAPGDFDGDGKTDFCAVRTGATSTVPMVWQILRSSDGAQFYRTFGISSDRVTQGDYDGDGRTDISVFRASTRVFYVIRSLDLANTGTLWGAPGDFPTATFDAR